jgi:hypothetical protein
MNSRQRRKQEANNHNGRYVKLKTLLWLMEGHKDEWVIRVCGATMTECQLDRWLTRFQL